MSTEFAVLNDYLLVELLDDEEEQTTETGLIIKSGPDRTKTIFEGLVHGAPEGDRKAYEGQTVLFTGAGSHKVTIDDVELLAITEQQLVAIIKKPEAEPSKVTINVVT